MQLPTGRPRIPPDVVAGVASAGFALLFLIDDRAADRATNWVAVLLVVAATLPLALRPRAPLTVLTVVSAALFTALAAGYAAGGAVVSLAWLFGCVAATFPTRTALAACSGSAVVVVAGPLAARGRLDAGEVVGGLLLLALPWLVGDRIRARAEAARTAARAERERIARDLHDTLAHALTTVAVQADAGDAVLDGDPERTRAALMAIRATAREALADIRSVVAGVRGTEDLGAIPDLVATVRRDGLEVDLVDRGPASVPPVVSATAYRVVQEALTNIRRHAGATRARVLVDHDAGCLVISVEDEGRGAQGAPAPGNGISGMRERVELCGGELTASGAPGTGFRVRARIPLAGAP